MSLRPFVPPGRRSFAATAIEKDLATALKNELVYEEENFEPNLDLKSVPGGYTIVDKPGDGLLTLSKTFEGETIEVTCEVNDQPDPEPTVNENGEEDALYVKTFLVSITKGEKMVTFEMSTDGEGANIEHMTLEPKGGFDMDSTMYTGPVFSELDQEVQDAAAKYLSERHVYDLGPYIFQYIDEKEQKLYMEWLQGTVKFLET